MNSSYYGDDDYEQSNHDLSSFCSEDQEAVNDDTIPSIVASWILELPVSLVTFASASVMKLFTNSLEDPKIGDMAHEEFICEFICDDSMSEQKAHKLKGIFTSGKLDINGAMKCFQVIPHSAYSYSFPGLTPLIASIRHRNISAFNFFLENGANPNIALPDDCEALLTFNLRFQDKLYKGTTPLQFVLLIICEENHFTGSDRQRSKSGRELSEEKETFEQDRKCFLILIEMARILLDLRDIDVRLTDRKGTSPLSMIPFLKAVNVKYNGPEMPMLAEKLRSKAK